ncbi:type II toxin-antitoxin system RelE/ParE family toxin [Alkalimonas mucilaginosa]|uniref:Type II toxin-antitoxin system RelE/ParE family toxin n=1 Tax=Alkalimonas mucilaginosa TaxID=3057676 RepID=A0ABU7JBY8_9GAMM|nr:type II toxin-antitoxin system RelE/ParE family toxin [Alkalimonas sp. MEB004]MEE2023175.1 type II toxin-antitoxin system RelE/ParE family toxin [Alkalimonas sp. MEB004]
MIFVETAVFTRLLKQLMSDDEYRVFQQHLANNPDSGKLIKNSGGLRKIRWGRDSQGKSGGVRVIYYFLQPDNQIRLLLIYPKNEQDNLTDKQLKLLKNIVERW